MGSFDVACGISNLTLGYGQKAGIVPLTRAYDGGDKGFHKFFSNQNDMFMPYLPPIFGVYDDYGNLKDIEDSPTVRYIEDFFGISAAAFVECIGNYGRELYDGFGPILKHYSHTIPENDYGQRSTDKDGSYLKAIGFVECEDGRYLFENWYVTRHNDHQWLVEHRKSNEFRPSKQFHCSNVRDMVSQFSRHTHTYPGFAKKDWNAISVLMSLYGMFLSPDIFNALRPMVKISRFYDLEGAHECAEQYSQKESLIQELRAQGATEEDIREENIVLLCIASKMEDTNIYQVMSLQSDNLLKSARFGMLDDVSMVLELHEIMGLMNRMFMPTFTGSDDGMNLAKRKMHQIAAELIRYDNDLDDYDDEE